jgi:lipoic acid synthetase
LPEWLRKPETHYEQLHAVKRGLRQLRLHTVCEAARCPNLHECFGRGTAAFLILGRACTRRCGYCAVPHGAPAAPLAPDPSEPASVARMAAALRLRHVVITSVTRDDLADGGASHFALAIQAVRRELPEARIEVLTPDFGGSEEALARVAEARPDVFNHNVETVPRLYPRVRPQAGYGRSLEVLRRARRLAPGLLTKSGLMVGLGEEPAEVESVLRDLREAGVDLVTIGQYLPPSRRNLPVACYVPPERFEAWRRYALSLGFLGAWSAPLVRSSYMAAEMSGRLWEAAC